ncbi:MAG: SagB/ThcOx family dehydrogenase [Kiritimatiellae bacterium]|nr:SagB/ThcOx family dehydrogenase [Kiritimatiellia bacterium]
MRYVIIGILIMMLMANPASAAQGAGAEEMIKLPSPGDKDAVSVETTLRLRASMNNPTDAPLTIDQFSLILLAAQGKNSTRTELRQTVTTAGANWPLDLYVAVGDKTCGDVPAGVYRYLPEEHALQLHMAGDQRLNLITGTGWRMQGTLWWMKPAPLLMFLTADFPKFGQRCRDFAPMCVYVEAGHAGQNIHLQAAALGLGTRMIGCFDLRVISNKMKLPATQEVIYLFPVFIPLKPFPLEATKPVGA